MPNYSPANEQGLLGLVQALKAGLDPSVAYSIYQGIQGDQAQTVAARQQRLSSLTDLLTGNAAQGMTAGQTSTLAEAQPGPMGPAAQSLLGTLYPRQDLPIPAQLQPGAAGSPWQIGQPMPTPIRRATQGAAPSPLYQPNPADQLQQQAAMSQAQQTIDQAGIQQAWTDLVADAQKYRAAGVTLDEFIQKAAQVYPELIGTDPQQFQQVVATVFHQGV